MVHNIGHPDLQTSLRYFLFVEHDKILCISEMLKHDMRFSMFSLCKCNLFKWQPKLRSVR